MRTFGYAAAALTSGAMGAALWSYKENVLRRAPHMIAEVRVLRFVAVLSLWRSAVFVFQSTGADLFDVLVLPVIPLLFGGLAWALWRGRQAMQIGEESAARALRQIDEANRRINGGPGDTG